MEEKSYMRQIIPDANLSRLMHGGAAMQCARASCLIVLGLLAAAWAPGFAQPAFAVSLLPQGYAFRSDKEEMAVNGYLNNYSGVDTADGAARRTTVELTDRMQRFQAKQSPDIVKRSYRVPDDLHVRFWQQTLDEKYRIEERDYAEPEGRMVSGFMCDGQVGGKLTDTGKGKGGQLFHPMELALHVGVCASTWDEPYRIVPGAGFPQQLLSTGAELRLENEAPMDVDGRSCLKLVWRRKADDLYAEVLVDPQENFLPLRMKVSKKGTLISESTAEETMRVGNHSFAKRWNTVFYGNGAKVSTRAVEILALRINEPIPPETFAVEFPADFVVLDQR